MTEIVGGPDIYVDCHSTLQMTCRVTSGNKTPAYIIWQRDDKVKFAQLDTLLNYWCQILKFDGGETSEVPLLPTDSNGRHISTLTIENIDLEASGEYSCQPAAGPVAIVVVHVLQRQTEVQAVLGEGRTVNGSSYKQFMNFSAGEDQSPAVTLPAITGGHQKFFHSLLAIIVICQIVEGIWVIYKTTYQEISDMVKWINLGTFLHCDSIEKNVYTTSLYL